MKINNANRFKEDLASKINMLGSIEEMDQYVCTLRTKKESTRLIMVRGI